MHRFKFALPLLVALVAGSGCDDAEPSVMNIPPSPRLALEGTVELADAEGKNKAAYAIIDRDVIADATESFDAQDEEFDLAFELEKPEGSSASVVIDAGGDTATITPDIAGEYKVTLIATDMAGQSQQKTLGFIARENQGPTASLEADEFGVLGLPTQLDATESADADDGFDRDDDLVYTWRLVDPAGADATSLLTGADTPSPRFVPAATGEYQAFLKVSDRFDETEEISVAIPVRGNGAPIADVDRSVSGQTGAAVTLDGSASFDPDEDELTIEWTLFDPAGADATDLLVDADTLTPSFVPTTAGTYRAVLVVSDGFAEPSEDAVLIDVAAAPGGAELPQFPELPERPELPEFPTGN